MSHPGTHDCSLGGLNLYGVSGACFGEEAHLVGEAVATYAARA